MPDQRVRIDWTQTKSPKAGCKAQILKFVRGIRGDRKNPVSRKQIANWLPGTPPDFVDECLIELLADGKVEIVRNSLSSGRRFNGAYRYQIALPQAA